MWLVGLIVLALFLTLVFPGTEWFIRLASDVIFSSGSFPMM